MPKKWLLMITLRLWRGKMICWTINFASLFSFRMFCRSQWFSPLFRVLPTATKNSRLWKARIFHFNSLKRQFLKQNNQCSSQTRLMLYFWFKNIDFHSSPTPLPLKMVQNIRWSIFHLSFSFTRFDEKTNACCTSIKKNWQGSCAYKSCRCEETHSCIRIV